MKKYTEWNWLQAVGVTTCFVGANMIWSLPTYIAAYAGAGWIPFYGGMVAVCLPIIYVQMKLGGFQHKNVIGIFSSYVPILKGVGLAGLIRSFIYSVVTSVVAAYCFLYAFESLHQPYEWGRCDRPWNSRNCDNSTSISSGVGSSVEYFQNEVLKLSEDVSSEGDILWKLAISLGGVWMITFLTISFGMNIFAMFMTFLGGVATVLALALTAYGREEVVNSEHGDIIYNATWERILEPTVVDVMKEPWLLGIIQGLILTKAWDGILPSIGKYTGRTAVKFNTSWLYVFLMLCIFPHIIINMLLPFCGGLSFITGLGLHQIINGGPRMLFVYIAAAFHFSNIKRGVAFLFYLTCGIFILESLCLWVAVTVDNIVDGTRTTKCCGKKATRLLSSSITYCIICFLFGLPLITQGGYYLIVLIYHWVDKLLFALIFISLFPYLIAYVKAPFNVCTKVLFGSWYVLASILAAVVFGHHSEIYLKPREFVLSVKYNEEYTYPQWAHIAGWLIAVTPIVVGVLFGLMHAVGSALGSGKQRCSAVCCNGQELEEPLKTYSESMQYME